MQYLYTAFEDGLHLGMTSNNNRLTHSSCGARLATNIVLSILLAMSRPSDAARQPHHQSLMGIWSR
jgi:hypothetical protein